MAVAMRDRVGRAGRATGGGAGHELGFGVGIAQGYATLGRIGFEGRFDYAAIGSVTNLAARLCGEAQRGQILVSQRVQHGAAEIAAGRSRWGRSRCADLRGRPGCSTWSNWR